MYPWPCPARSVPRQEVTELAQTGQQVPSTKWKDFEPKRKRSGANSSPPSPSNSRSPSDYTPPERWIREREVHPTCPQLVTVTALPVAPWWTGPPSKRDTTQSKVKGAAEGSEMWGSRGCPGTGTEILGNRGTQQGVPGAHQVAQGEQEEAEHGTGEGLSPFASPHAAGAWGSAATSSSNPPAPPLRPWFQSSLDYTVFAFVDSTFTCTCQARCK